jgi:hypothetical protein
LPASSTKARAVADVGIERTADPNFNLSAKEGDRLRNAARADVPNPFARFARLFRQTAPKFFISDKPAGYPPARRDHEVPGFNRLFFAILRI